MIYTKLRIVTHIISCEQQSSEFNMHTEWENLHSFCLLQYTITSAQIILTRISMEYTLQNGK